MNPIAVIDMRGSRVYCQRGSYQIRVFFLFLLLLLLFLIHVGREDPNTITSGPSSARQKSFCWRANDGQTLNAVLVAL